MWKKIEVWISCIWLVSRSPNSGSSFRKFNVELVWKSFSDSMKPRFFIFLTVFNMVWKNQESCESWLVGFCLVGIQKCKKFLPTFFLLRFWAAINDLLITLKCQFLLFLMSYLEEFQPAKYYLSRISTFRNIKL